MFPELLGGILGSGLGNLLGGGGSQPNIGKQIEDLVNGMNTTLNDYLNKAMNAGVTYTNAGVNQEVTSKNEANNALTTYLQKAQQNAAQQSYLGQQRAQSYLQPFLMSGATAQDAYMDSLGLSRPTVGYGAVQDALMAQNNADYQRSFLGQAPQAPQGPAPIVGNAPTMASMLSSVTPDQINQYLQQHMSNVGGSLLYSGAGAGTKGSYNGLAGNALATRLPGTDNLSNYFTMSSGPNAGQLYNPYAAANQFYGNDIKQAIAQYQLGQAQNQYANQQAALNTYNQQQAAYNNYQNQYNSFAPNANQQSILNMINSGMIR